MNKIEDYNRYLGISTNYTLQQKVEYELEKQLTGRIKELKK